MWIFHSPRLLRCHSCQRSDGSATLPLSLLRTGAFTLVEVLSVVGVMVVLTSLAIPAFNAIRGGTDFSSEVYNIAGMLDEARSYAIANSTYVLAGIDEVSAAQDTSARPQAAGTGRIAVAIIAATNGTRPYQSLLPGNLTSWTSLYGTGSAFRPVTSLMVFPNLHMVDLQPSTSITGNMARPTVAANYDLPNVSGTSGTQFAWPLGTTFTTSSQYTFSKVIEYDPQGSARFINPASNSASLPEAIPLFLEIGLEPSHGTAFGVPSSGQTSGQIAAIQVNGINGISHIYRP